LTRKIENPGGRLTQLIQSLRHHEKPPGAPSPETHSPEQMIFKFEDEELSGSESSSKADPAASFVESGTNRLTSGGASLKLAQLGGEEAKLKKEWEAIAGRISALNKPENKEKLQPYYQAVVSLHRRCFSQKPRGPSRNEVVEIFQKRLVSTDQKINELSDLMHVKFSDQVRAKLAKMLDEDEDSSALYLTLFDVYLSSYKQFNVKLQLMLDEYQDHFDDFEAREQAKAAFARDMGWTPGATQRYSKPPAVNGFSVS